MERKPIVYKIAEKVDVHKIAETVEEVDYDISSRHWLLAVAVFFLGCQIMVSWSMNDIKDGILGAAVAQKKASEQILQLEDEVASLRKDIVAYRQGAPSIK